MNFIEFNVPQILEHKIDSWTKGKNVLEYTYKKGILRIVGMFDPMKLQNRIEKDYEKEFNEYNKQNDKVKKEIKKAFAKIKDKYTLQSKQD